MSHVSRTAFSQSLTGKPPEEIKKRLEHRKWQTVDIRIAHHDLVEHIAFLDDAVVLRNSPEGVPLMTTTAIYGPIRPRTKVALTPWEGTGVRLIEEDCTEESLIRQLEDLQSTTAIPKDGNAVIVHANWVSSENGGTLPNLDPSANVFGSTGSLYVNDSSVTLPVLDVSHPDYHQTLAFYGGKLLVPEEEFYMGFNKILFGVEYNTSLPDYIRNYAMSPSGGGGMFVETHPFPHIFLPRPTADGHVYCEAKVTLGRKVGEDEGDEESRKKRKRNPEFRFTSFRVPSNGSAIAIMPDTIHNDSFTNGRLAVFVADTKADTVAFRQTAPFTNIRVKDNEPKS